MSTTSGEGADGGCGRDSSNNSTSENSGTEGHSVQSAEGRQGSVGSGNGNSSSSKSSSKKRERKESQDQSMMIQYPGMMEWDQGYSRKSGCAGLHSGDLDDRSRKWGSQGWAGGGYTLPQNQMMANFRGVGRNSQQQQQQQSGYPSIGQQGGSVSGHSDSSGYLQYHMAAQQPPLDPGYPGCMGMDFGAPSGATAGMSSSGYEGDWQGTPFWNIGPAGASSRENVWSHQSHAGSLGMQQASSSHLPRSANASGGSSSPPSSIGDSDAPSPPATPSLQFNNTGNNRGQMRHQGGMQQHSALQQQLQQQQQGGRGVTMSADSSSAGGSVLPGGLGGAGTVGGGSCVGNGNSNAMRSGQGFWMGGVMPGHMRHNMYRAMGTHPSMLQSCQKQSEDSRSGLSMVQHNVMLERENEMLRGMLARDKQETLALVNMLISKQKEKQATTRVNP